MFMSASSKNILGSPYCFVWKIIIKFSCKGSSMLISVTVDVGIFYNFSLKYMIPLLDISLFQNSTKIIFSSKDITIERILSDCG